MLYGMKRKAHASILHTSNNLVQGNPCKKQVLKYSQVRNSDEAPCRDSVINELGRRCTCEFGHVSLIF